jgi:O-antigen/teichoic acid export membrane protein
MGGTVGAQLLSILATPFVTRLYNPEDLGLLSVYASIIGLVVVVANLRYEQAILLPESDAEAAQLVALSVLITVGMIVLIVIIAVIFGSRITGALRTTILADYFWMLPLGVLLGGVYNASNYWVVRTKKYSILARVSIFQIVPSILIQLTAFTFGGVALILAQLTGQSVACWILARETFSDKAFRHITWNQLVASAVRYKRFPIFSTGEGLTNAAATMITPLLFSALFSVTAVGFYSLAYRVLLLPLSLLGSAVSMVFFAEAANAKREGRLRQLTNLSLIKLAQIGIAPLFLIILIGPELFVFVFGEKWRTTGEFARVMAPWIYLNFIYSPLSPIIAVMEQQGTNLAFQMLLLLARVAVIIIGATTGDLLITIIGYSVVSALFYLVSLFWIAHLAGIYAREVITPILSAICACAVCTSPMLFIKVLSLGDRLEFVVSSVFITSILLIVWYWILIRKAYRITNS